MLNEVTDFRILEDARIANDSVNTAITNYKRALTYLIFEDFRKQYACIKMLAAEELQEAMQIWAVMRTVWDHLRGLRGTMCEIKTVETHNYASLQITEMY